MSRAGPEPFRAPDVVVYRSHQLLDGHWFRTMTGKKMKRQKPKRNSRSKRAGSQNSLPAKPVAEAPVDKGRRKFLDFARSWGVVAVVAAGGGWYLADDVMATMAEQDLSRIGNGIPTVVQIHDPTCPRCAELQREARKAMKGFDDEELQFVVANIRSAKGQALASKHGVGHITLLLLDGTGKRRDVLQGNNYSDHLKAVFRSHADRFAKPAS